MYLSPWKELLYQEAQTPDVNKQGRTLVAQRAFALTIKPRDALTRWSSTDQDQRRLPIPQRPFPYVSFSDFRDIFIVPAVREMSRPAMSFSTQTCPITSQPGDNLFRQKAPRSESAVPQRSPCPGAPRHFLPVGGEAGSDAHTATVL